MKVVISIESGLIRMAHVFIGDASKAIESVKLVNRNDLKVLKMRYPTATIKRSTS
jgi:hypothetical protein